MVAIFYRVVNYHRILIYACDFDAKANLHVPNEYATVQRQTADVVLQASAKDIDEKQIVSKLVHKE